MNRLLLIVSLLMSTSAFAQVNYVLNPDFELYSECPKNYDDMTFATNWSGVDSMGQNSCVPDYCHTCADVNSPIAVPHGDKYFQIPLSGSGFAELVVYAED